MTPLEIQALEIERQWWRYPGAKAETISSKLGLTPTRYAQILNRLLDDPEALAAEPVLINRLRRHRAAKLRARSAGLDAVGESS
jgi:hypothetical protein